MEIKQIRRNNLLLLLTGSSRKAFAERADLSYAHLNQMVKGFRNIGDDVARRIENKLGLDHGWMDHEQKLRTHAAEQPKTTYDTVNQAEIDEAMAKFRDLHPAFREYIIQTMDRLEHLYQALPEPVRRNLRAPTSAAYLQWQSEIAADFARLNKNNGHEKTRQ